jgi:dTDP-glucose pyrophosphorylase
MKKIKIGIIPAAGKGSRLSDLLLTRVLPKPMLPILNKPLLEYALTNMKSVGVEEVYIIVRSKKEIIREYFGNGEDFDLKITYIEQNPPRGIAHAMSLARCLISEPFAVILGDDLTITRSLNNVVKTFWEKKAIAVEGAVFEEDIDAIKRACCVVLKTDGQITEIIEKPLIPKSNLRGIGVYLFDPLVFDYIEMTPVSTKRNEKEITDTIGLVSKEGRAYAALINGSNINVNTSFDLTAATKLLLKTQNPRNKSLSTRMKK